MERPIADARDRVPKGDAGELVVVERTITDARDRVWDRDAGETDFVKCERTDARDGVTVEGVGDDEVSWTGTTGTASHRSCSTDDLVSEPARLEGPRRGARGEERDADNRAQQEAA